MATILPFVRNAFDPKDVQAMSTALDDVCRQLNVHEAPGKEVIAERIVSLASRGVRSPTVLRERVLHEAGEAERVGSDAGTS